MGSAGLCAPAPQGRAHPTGAPKHGAPRPGASQASRVRRPSPAWLGMSTTVSFHPQDVKKDREQNHQNPGSRRESTPTQSLTSRPCRKTSHRPQTRMPRGRAGAHMCPVGTACRCRVATPCPAACHCCCQPTAAPCCPPRPPSPQVGGPEVAPWPPSLRGPCRVCLCPVPSLHGRPALCCQTVQREPRFMEPGSAGWHLGEPGGSLRSSRMTGGCRETDGGVGGPGPHKSQACEAVLRHSGTSA